jgi:uncharacterized damage-inducible protein DinB
MITKPSPGESSDYAQSYIDHLTEDDLLEALSNNLLQTVSLFESVAKEKHNFRYAPGKWTVKELLQHIIDTERIFSYRALRFSRRDNTPLPSYDENLYAPNANTSVRSLEKLLEEYRLVRESSILLFESMTPEMLDFKGTASSVMYSARILGWFMAGHNLHHNKVLKVKYLG